MKTLFTDLELLKTIHELYYDEYYNMISCGVYDLTEGVTIDLDKIAKDIGSNKHLIQDRLSNHLNIKHKESHKRLLYSENGISNAPHTINFTHLCSILAKLQDDDKEIKTANRNANISILIASLSALFTLLSAII